MIKGFQVCLLKADSSSFKSYAHHLYELRCAIICDWLGFKNISRTRPPLPQVLNVNKYWQLFAFFFTWLHKDGPTFDTQVILLSFFFLLPNPPPVTMEPLSLTTNIISIVGAAKNASKKLEKLVKLRHAPQQVLSLFNEVWKFNVFLI